MVAYLRAYLMHRRTPGDAYYAWRCWDARLKLEQC